jgi:hypothetical protein
MHMMVLRRLRLSSTALRADHDPSRVACACACMADACMACLPEGETF